jgi:MFS family permease
MTKVRDGVRQWRAALRVFTVSNVPILFIAQALTGTGLTAVVLFGGILGAELAPGPSWVTAPVSLAVVGMALTTVPASLLMRITGRKVGLVVGAAIGAVASLLCAFAIGRSSFVLFCLGSMLYGAATAFAMQYRFVAAESVTPERASQAISIVLLGSLAAALIGPQAAMAARAWIEPHEYAGSFLAVGVMYTLGALALSRLRPTDAGGSATTGDAPSVRQLLRQPMLQKAVLAGAVAFAVMSFIMTAAPVSMHSIHQHSVTAITWTIQSHILAMYLPSLFSGKLIQRFGESRIMIAGSVLLGASALASLVGHDVPHYWIGLVLLGVGWNFLFTAGTTLLATHYTGVERHRAQAINDFVVFTSQACVSLLAGLAVTYLGWHWTNLSVVPLLILMLWVAVRKIAPPLREHEMANAIR